MTKPDGDSSDFEGREFQGLHFYGRRKGRKLRSTMQALLDGQLPLLRYDPAKTPVAQLDRQPDDIFLEIGFGGGENLAAVAAARPDAKHA